MLSQLLHRQRVMEEKAQSLHFWTKPPKTFNSPSRSGGIDTSKLSALKISNWSALSSRGANVGNLEWKILRLGCWRSRQTPAFLLILQTTEIAIRYLVTPRRLSLKVLGWIGSFFQGMQEIGPWDWSLARSGIPALVSPWSGTWDVEDPAWPLACQPFCVALPRYGCF